MQTDNSVPGALTFADLGIERLTALEAYPPPTCAADGA